LAIFQKALKMKKQITYTCLTFLFVIIHPFEEDIRYAVAFLRTQEETIIQIKNTSTSNNAEVLAIVSPEIIRWSAFKDFFETSALELLYVNKGKTYANFSIGHFQMKPSFVEQLETYVSQHESLNTLSYIVIVNKSVVETRRERINRLTQFAWQLRYAHVFWAVATDKFENRIFNNQESKVRFFAAAYNYGFMRLEKDVEEKQFQKSFPFGVNYKGEQVAYTDLSLEFLRQYASKF
jgi:hypothetical protein